MSFIDFYEYLNRKEAAGLKQKIIQSGTGHRRYYNGVSGGLDYADFFKNIIGLEVS